MSNLGFKNNFLFYTQKNKQYQELKKVISDMKIPFVEVQLNDTIMTKQFVEMLVEFTDNGFDDLIKNPKKYTMNVDVYELKFSEMVQFIIKNYENVLKTAIFFGKIGGKESKHDNYKTMSGVAQDEYTVYLPYRKREMSKIYG